MKKHAWLLAILALSIPFSACTKKNSFEDDGKLNVMNVPIQDEAKALDPANAYDGVSLEISPQIYEALFQYEYLADSYKVAPLLAADMPKYSKDRLTLTIPVRRGVRFHDDPVFKGTGGKGRELKAQDFIFAWKRLAYPGVQSQGWWIFDGKIKGINEYHDKLEKASKDDFQKVADEEVAGFKALDDYTIQITLTKPYPQLMYVLCMTFTAAVAKEAALAYSDEKGNFNDKQIGTGAFMLTKWDRGYRVVLDRNPHFHTEFYPVKGSETFRKQGMLADAGKPLPFMDRIVFTIMRETQPRWLNFMNGSLDMVVVPKDNFAAAIDEGTKLKPELIAKGVKLDIDVGGRFYYVTFNMKDKVIGGSKLLRQAMSSAIDRDAWIELFTNGRGKKAINALPPGLPDRAATGKIKYDFDLAHAKELLKKAGFPNGDGLAPIKFDMRGADTVNRQMGEFFTKQFAAIGIKLEVIYNTFPAYLEKAKQGNFQVSYGGWGLDYPDAENVFQLVYGPNKAPGPNDANYDNPEMNKLYEEMAIMESSPKRAAIVKRMDEILQEDCPWALGYYHAEYSLSQPWMLNFRANEIIQTEYKYYRIDPAIRARFKGQKQQQTPQSH